LKPSTRRPDSGQPGPGRLGGTGAPRVVSLLTDYGLADGFAGALHSVLRAHLPQVPIVDLTHEVRPQDVRAGSLALKRVAPYLADGVVIAIVDPGVGTQRRAVAVQAAEADLTFVGPDNGLLVPALEALGGPALAVELENPTYQLASPGPTFAGRDIFAPAAAYLVGGGDIGALGRQVDPGTLARLPPSVCRERDGAYEVEVTWVDRFGNVQLAAGADALAVLAGPAGHVTVAPPGNGGSTWPARAVHTYGDLTPGELGILVDSYGHLAMCLNGASAANRLGTGEQDVLVLRPALREPACSPRSSPGPRPASDGDL
jgi:S-adenosyl-L-methionine hydrolase (adenosine-forming)